jgi:hypothetical protein
VAAAAVGRDVAVARIDEAVDAVAGEAEGAQPEEVGPVASHQPASAVPPSRPIAFFGSKSMAASATKIPISENTTAGAGEAERRQHQ